MVFVILPRSGAAKYNIAFGEGERGQDMAAKKVGEFIKEARTAAGLTQEQLARKIAGLSAADISKAERGQMDLTQAQLKEIAKATGVTQSSLLNAAKGTGGKTSGSTGTRVTVTATEKRLLEYYRAADSKTRSAALKLLKGEGSGSLVQNLVSTALGTLAGKREHSEGNDDS